MKDMATYMGVRPAFKKSVASGDATNAITDGDNTTPIDTLGFDSMTFAVTGKWSATDGDKKMMFEVWHGDDSGSLVRCEDHDMTNPHVALTYAAPTAKVGYIGGRRYVQLRPKMSEALGSATIDTVAMAILLRPQIAPTA